MSVDLQSLDREANLFDFFHSHVGEAAREADPEVSEEGLFYLSNLLVERGRTEPGPMEPQTLVELQLAAVQAPRVQALGAWRELGDKALYVMGFFHGSLERRTISPDYYAHMGAAAYHRLSRILHAPGVREVGGTSGHKGIDAIFAELSARFTSCTRILRAVREALRAHVAQSDDQALLALYEEWLQTGDPEVARQLRRLGLSLSSKVPTA